MTVVITFCRLHVLMRSPEVLTNVLDFYTTLRPTSYIHFFI